MSAPPVPPPPQNFPYDYLFKVLIIGDASVGKVSEFYVQGGEIKYPSQLTME